MCGRYTVTVSLDEMMLYYLTQDVSFTHYKPNFNVSPMHYVPAVIDTGESKRIGELQWGLVPFWSKDEKSGVKMINARAETVSEKPAFKRLLNSRRCLIVADSFYEWKKNGDKKQPMRILLRDKGIFSFAGLYDMWETPDGSKLSTCSIITTEPNSLMAEIHDRMPVILRKEDEAEWIDRENHDVSVLQKLLRPYDAASMRAYPVSTKVGNVRNNYPELLEEAK